MSEPFSLNIIGAQFADKSKKENPPKKLSADILFGTGVNKKVISKAETLRKKESQQVENTTITSSEAEDILDVPVIELEKEQDDIKLDEYQLTALSGLRTQKYGTLIGAAGTGKTTTVKRLVQVLESTVPTIDLNKTQMRETTDNYNVAICFCAFTGRAVQQMKLNLPKTYHPMANTIHATLGYAPVIETYLDEEDNVWKERKVFRPTFTADNKLAYKICIVDEAGMTPINLWNELLAALPNDCRIILIGDINQLPPVFGHSVLGYAMIHWPTFTLEKLHRNAGVIAQQAHLILKGLYPNPNLDKTKFMIKKLPDGSVSAADKIFNAIVALHKMGKFDPFKDALIVPQNKGTLGQLNLNSRLVLYFNAEKKDENGAILNKRIVISAGYVHVTYAVGDKVMLLQNDRKRGLTNGMTGIVVSIHSNARYTDSKGIGHATMEKLDDGFSLDTDGLEEDFNKLADEALLDADDENDINQQQASHIMTVKFTGADGGEEVTFSTSGQYRTVCHAYAHTCHKSQGTEYPTVVIVCHSANAVMLNREWLYTAVTRSQSNVVILCNDRGLMQAVNKQVIDGKTVEEKAKQYLALSKSEFNEQPDLPEPQIIEVEENE